jgi:hypothetical protein
VFQQPVKGILAFSAPTQQEGSNDILSQMAHGCPNRNAAGKVTMIVAAHSVRQGGYDRLLLIALVNGQGHHCHTVLVRLSMTAYVGAESYLGAVFSLCRWRARGPLFL